MESKRPRRKEGRTEVVDRNPYLKEKQLVGERESKRGGGRSGVVVRRTGQNTMTEG